MPDVRQKQDMSDPPALLEGVDIEASVPDYPMAATVRATSPAHLKALSDPVRRSIIDLVLERAATTTELAAALGRPKGTVDHHVKVLASAGLLSVVRTRKVRAMTERYWGRTARTILFDLPSDGAASPCASFIHDALEEALEAGTPPSSAPEGYTTLRHARIDRARAAEFATRLHALALEFTAAERGGDVELGLLIALYPTARPTLPDADRTGADRASDER